ncbi:MAG: hypothetical protein KDC76_14620, partial [Bacteroidetes bacterium]|nr:hypothetical protein [Bacteroidota bacterium]
FVGLHLRLFYLHADIMKSTGFFILLLLVGTASALAQYDDDVLYTAYRYHPKAQIIEQQIDSCFIYIEKDDSLSLDQVILYNGAGNEAKVVDFGSNLEYQFTYDSVGHLITSKLWDWDYGEGPVDSMVYDEQGREIAYYNLFQGMVSQYNSYVYTDSLLTESISEHFKTKYFYRNGKRSGYLHWTSRGIEEYVYERNDSGQLTHVYFLPTAKARKQLRYELSYTPAGLLKQMDVYDHGELDQRYITIYDSNGLIARATHISSIRTTLSVTDFVYRYHRKM